MARHFLGLYLLIVITLAAVSWGQDAILQMYDKQDPAEEKALVLALVPIEEQLASLPEQQRDRRLAELRARYGLDIELLPVTDIVGDETLAKLKSGQLARMVGSHQESWTLKQVDADHVLALKSFSPRPERGLLEWALTAAFYAVIALVIMIWIWPLRRDLRVLERAAAGFGDGHWLFEANIKPRSQIHSLAVTFRRMAQRIDGLIASHKDMSNAVSHEIKTPLARMQFEIELALQAEQRPEMRKTFDNLKGDVAAINELVTATLDYAILERANVSLNLAAHDFGTLVPSLVEHVKRDARPGIQLHSEVQGDARAVICDAHLLETILRNLLYNSIRYARRDVRVTFIRRDGENRLLVDDDGPGIPEKDRERVFESFVQLDRPAGPKSGFGLGLAIVKRAIEWHRGTVFVERSPLGGARFCATWPAMPSP
jgi:two-component system, OmpR family, sensor kinase